MLSRAPLLTLLHSCCFLSPFCLFSVLIRWIENYQEKKSCKYKQSENSIDIIGIPTHFRSFYSYMKMIMIMTAIAIIR